MKLYVCYGTFGSPRPGGHPCGNAANALREAGHDPEVIKVHGLGIGPKIPLLIQTGGRSRVEELSGQRLVPVLELDDGTVVKDSKNIIAWAEKNPAKTLQ